MENTVFLRRIAKGAGILFVGIIVSKLLTYAFRAIVARYFGASVYGLLILAIAITSFIASLALLGLPKGLLRYIAYYLGKSNKVIIAPMIGSVMKYVLPLCLLLGVVIFLFARRVSVFFFHKPELTPYLQVASVIVPLFALYSIFDNVLQAFQDAKAFVIARNLVDPLGKLLMLALLISLGVGIWGVTFAYVFGIACSVVAMFFFLKGRMLNFSAVFFRPGQLSKSLVYYSLPLLLADFFSMIMVWTDVIVLGAFVTSSMVGVYDAASVSSRLLSMVPLAFSTIFMPSVTELFARDRMNVGKIYKQVIKWVLITLLPIFMFLAMFSRPMLSIFFGQEFGSGAVSLIILLAGQFFWGVGLFASNILAIAKRTKFIFYNTVLGGFLNLALNLVLIPKFGIVGAAVSTSVSMCFITVLFIVEASYITRAWPFSASILRPVLSIAIPVFALYVIFGKFIIDVSIVYLAIIGAVFCISYLLLLFITKSFDSEDLELFRAAVKKYNPIKR